MSAASLERLLLQFDRRFNSNSGGVVTVQGSSILDLMNLFKRIEGKAVRTNQHRFAMMHLMEVYGTEILGGILATINKHVHDEVGVTSSRVPTTYVRKFERVATAFGQAKAQPRPTSNGVSYAEWALTQSQASLSLEDLFSSYVDEACTIMSVDAAVVPINFVTDFNEKGVQDLRKIYRIPSLIPVVLCGTAAAAAPFIDISFGRLHFRDED